MQQSLFLLFSERRMGNIKIYSPNVQKKSTYIMIFISLSLTLIYVHVCKTFFNVISILIPFVSFGLDLVVVV